MKEYLCHVARADGTTLTLRRTTGSQTVLVRDLGTEGYLILKLEEATADSERPTGKLKSPSVLRFTEILATLTANGLGLKEALALARPLGGKDLGSFLSALDARVQKGHSLYQALKDGPRGFSVLYLGLIRIGEQTGDLATIFPRLVEYLKSRQALRDKTVNALVYPIFVMTVALVGIAGLSLFVLPALTGSIAGLNPEVAQQYRDHVTAFQTGVSLFFGLLLFAGVAVVVLRRASTRSADGAVRFDRALLGLPLVGALSWQSFCLHVSFSLEILLSSGYSLESALGECAAVVTNRALQASWGRVRDRVVKGTTLSQSLRQETGYPEVFLGWVEVGESAHDLKRSFAQLRAFYQNQIDLLSARFASLVEPALIVLVGVMVIALVLTFITPLYSMLGRLF